MMIESENKTKFIPFHRIRCITYDGKCLWEKPPTPKGSYHVRLLAVKDAPALGDILRQSIIQLGTDHYLDLGIFFPKERW